MRISLTTLIILSPYDLQAKKAVQSFGNLAAYKSETGNIIAHFDERNGFRTQLIDHAANEARSLYET